jgi:RND family efflux transporter MFP subunit
MKRFSAGALTAVVVAIVTAVAVSRHDASTPAGAASGAGGASAPPPAQTVSLATATRRDVPVVVEASGSVVPVDTVDVRAQVAAVLRAVHIKDGQFVRAGDLLFTLDDRADRANLDKARQQALKDRAALADAQRQLARAQELLAQNFISPSAIDTARATVDGAQAAVRADEAAVQAAEVALGYDVVRAPLAGRTGVIAVNPGALVSPTGAALVTISRIDPVNVQFTVPESDVASLLKGLAAGAPVRVMSGADTLEGRLVFVDNAIDAGTGTIKAKAQFTNAKQLLWPGQFVRVRLTLRTLEGAVVVPQAAVIQRGNDRGVYVVGADRVAQWRVITLVQPDGDSVALQGVREGERVVVDGKQNVRPGTPVREAGAGAGAGAGAAKAGAAS